MNSSTTNTDVLDEIVREIDIAASRERVFALASTPGWWINDGEVVDHEIDTDDRGRSVVHDPVHGDFVLQTVEVRPPDYVAFRWLSAPDAGSGEESSTLVEFFVESVESGSVRLRVRESGFASLATDAEERRRRFEDNTEGWAVEFGAFQRRVESA